MQQLGSQRTPFTSCTDCRDGWALRFCYCITNYFVFRYALEPSTCGWSCSSLSTGSVCSEYTERLHEEAAEIQSSSVSASNKCMLYLDSSINKMSRLSPRQVLIALRIVMNFYTVADSHHMLYPLAHHSLNCSGILREALAEWQGLESLYFVNYKAIIRVGGTPLVSEYLFSGVMRHACPTRFWTLVAAKINCRIRL